MSGERGATKDAPTDLEIVQQVRRWIDSKEAEIDNRMLRRVCHLAEQQIRRTVKSPVAVEPPFTCLFGLESCFAIGHQCEQCRHDEKFRSNAK